MIDDVVMLCAQDGRRFSPAACRDRVILPLGRLIRWRLSLAAAGSVSIGMFLQRPEFNVLLLTAALGGFLGSAACSALNQLQERHLDAVMRRTKRRPLVACTLQTPIVVMMIGPVFLLSGALLYWVGKRPALVTLLVIIAFYNGLYTFLKGKTTFFLLPGAIAGACPPVLGWLCSGGSLMNPKCLVLFSVFFVWQIPHFWLFAERHHEDYSEVGIRFPWSYFSGNERNIQHLWICAFAIILLLLPGVGIIHSAAGKSVIVGLSSSLILVTFTQRMIKQHLFHVFNGTLLTALAIPLLEHILSLTGR